MRNLFTSGLGPLRVALLGVAMVWVGGCHSPLDAPAGWRSMAADEFALVHAVHADHGVSSGHAGLEPGGSEHGGLKPPGLGAYRMQVLICYDSVSSSHAAIRLISPATTLFWDPGGLLGHEGRGGLVRVNSIIEGPPTLDEYWAWRQSFTELAMQAFEYDLMPAEHAALFEVLDSCRTRMREDGFTTNWVGGQCCVGTSHFLRKYFGGRMTVSHDYFWPHSLATELWSQPVGRVYDYRRGNEKCRVLLPP